jgi:glycosyltransferase involved in cell wall biosynthesis
MPRHIVITPVKNEERFIQGLIQSMVNQKVLPSTWIIVDDCSNDGTKTIIDQAANEYPWIRYEHSGLESPRSRGEKISKLFIKGIEACESHWDYCSKIDADMILPEDYFEVILNEFQQDEKLGICSGNCYYEKAGKKKFEKVIPGHTRGGLKTYRYQCYTDIGGIPPVDGWDGIDNTLARMRGWEARNLNRLFVHHRRETGSFDGALRGAYENGKRSHFMGYSPFYMSIKTVHHAISKFSLLSSISMFIGYMASLISLKPKYENEEVIKQIRREKYGILKAYLFGWIRF